MRGRWRRTSGPRSGWAAEAAPPSTRWTRTAWRWPPFRRAGPPPRVTRGVHMLRRSSCGATHTQIHRRARARARACTLSFWSSLSLSKFFMPPNPRSHLYLVPAPTTATLPAHALCALVSLPSRPNAPCTFPLPVPLLTPRGTLAETRITLRFSRAVSAMTGLGLRCLLPHSPPFPSPLDRILVLDSSTTPPYTGPTRHGSAAVLLANGVLPLLVRGSRG